jgi:hypothetical protein
MREKDPPLPEPRLVRPLSTGELAVVSRLDLALGLLFRCPHSPPRPAEDAEAITRRPHIVLARRAHHPVPPLSRPCQDCAHCSTEVLALFRGKLALPLAEDFVFYVYGTGALDLTIEPTFQVRDCWRARIVSGRLRPA